MGIGDKIVFVLIAGVVGAFLGWQVGESQLPKGAELETAVYPVTGAAVGALLGMALVGIYIAVVSRRGR
jgi:hypothetical protein